MSDRTDHKLGLTPMIKRAAFYYLLLGRGEHVSNLPGYDKVVVKPLYDWKNAPDETQPSQGGAVVEFWRDGKRVRWVDFGCRVVGGGGPPLLHEV